MIFNIDGGSTAEQIKYDNSKSGLESDNVQGAVDELSDSLGGLRFGTDGEGNYGYFGDDDVLIPFSSGDSFYTEVKITNSNAENWVEIPNKPITSFTILYTPNETLSTSGKNVCTCLYNKNMSETLLFYIIAHPDYHYGKACDLSTQYKVENGKAYINTSDGFFKNGIWRICVNY